MKTKALILILSFMPSLAMAQCDFHTGISQVPGGYLYTEECHLQVGKDEKELTSSRVQIADLTKAIELKDLAITKSDARATLWIDTSTKMEEKLQRVDELQKKNEFLYFGLGVLATVGAGFMAAKLLQR